MSDSDRNTPGGAHDRQAPVRVVNRAVGAFRTLLQVGTVAGDVHLHPSRWTTAVVIAVWLPALVAVFSLVPADSARQALPSMASDPPIPSAPTTGVTGASTTTFGVPPVRPAETRTIVVQVPGAPVTVMDGLRISVKTAGFTSTYDGDVDCGGGGNGAGGGAASSSAAAPRASASSAWSTTAFSPPH